MLPHLKDFMMKTCGISLEHKITAQVRIYKTWKCKLKAKLWFGIYKKNVSMKIIMN